MVAVVAVVDQVGAVGLERASKGSQGEGSCALRASADDAEVGVAEVVVRVFADLGAEAD